MPLYFPWRSKASTPQVESIPTTDGGARIQVIRGREMLEIAELRQNMVHALVIRADGTIEDLGANHNTRTNGGADWQADLMGNAAGTPAKYIGLTTDTTTISAASTTLTSELSTNGLARALGTYAHTNGTTSYTISKTFSATGTQASIHRAGLFTASSAGTLVFITDLNADASVANGDSLAITWTVNL